MIKSLVELDDYALIAARDLAARQPRCDHTGVQLENQPNPVATDVLALWRPDNVPGGADVYGVTLQTLATFFGTGGGTFGLPTVFTFTGSPFNGAVSPAPASTNNNAMNTLCTTLQALCPPFGGGTGFFPAGNYLIDSVAGSASAATGGYPVPSQTVFWGSGTIVGANTGSSQPPAMFQVSVASSSVPNVLFHAGGGNHTYGGAVFRNIGISYPPGSNIDSTAILLHGTNDIAENCAFYNAPCSVVIDSLHGGMRNCTVQYQVTGALGPNGSSSPTAGAGALPMIVIESPQGFVDNCELQQLPINHSPAGPTGICGVLISGKSGGEHNNITNTHFVDFDYGVSWGIPWLNGTTLGSSNYDCIINCEIAAATSALYMGMEGGTTGTNAIWGTRIIGNTFFQSQHATVNTSAIFWIDPHVVGSTINDILFSSNSLFQSLNDGIYITGGSNLRFATSSIAGNAHANINIAGNATNSLTVGRISISDCNLGATYSQGNNPQTATFGLLINSANLLSTSVIEVSNCFFGTGFGTQAVSVTGTQTTGSIINIVNSPGYNDINTVVSQSGGGGGVANIPTTATAAQLAGTLGSPAGTACLNYYGPTTVQWTTGASGVTVTVNGLANTYIAGQVGFVYLAKPSDKITFSGSANAQVVTGTFLWTGK